MVTPSQRSFARNLGHLSIDLEDRGERPSSVLTAGRLGRNAWIGIGVCLAIIAGAIVVAASTASAPPPGRAPVHAPAMATPTPSEPAIAPSKPAAQVVAPTRERPSSPRAPVQAQAPAPAAGPTPPGPAVVPATAAASPLPAAQSPPPPPPAEPAASPEPAALSEPTPPEPTPPEPTPAPTHRDDADRLPGLQDDRFFEDEAEPAPQADDQLSSGQHGQAPA